MELWDLVLNPNSRRWYIARDLLYQNPSISGNFRGTLKAVLYFKYPIAKSTPLQCRQPKDFKASSHVTSRCLLQPPEQHSLTLHSKYAETYKAPVPLTALREKGKHLDGGSIVIISCSDPRVVPVEYFNLAPNGLLVLLA